MSGTRLIQESFLLGVLERASRLRLGPKEGFGSENSAYVVSPEFKCGCSPINPSRDSFSSRKMAVSLLRSLLGTFQSRESRGASFEIIGTKCFRNNSVGTIRLQDSISINQRNEGEVVNT